MDFLQDRQVAISLNLFDILLLLSVKHIDLPATNPDKKSKDKCLLFFLNIFVGDDDAEI